MLELRNLTKRFGNKQIFSNYDLVIPEGKIVAVVGQSGGGKTTLLRMLAGLETIDSGTLIYNGQTLPLEELEKRHLLGFVFQDFQLFPHLSVLENLILSPIKTQNMSRSDAEDKARVCPQHLQRRNGFGLAGKPGPHRGRYANAAHGQTGKPDQHQKGPQPVDKTGNLGGGAAGVGPARARLLQIRHQRRPGRACDPVHQRPAGRGLALACHAGS